MALVLRRRQSPGTLNAEPTAFPVKTNTYALDLSRAHGSFSHYHAIITPLHRQPPPQQADEDNKPPVLSAVRAHQIFQHLERHIDPRTFAQARAIFDGKAAVYFWNSQLGPHYSKIFEMEPGSQKMYTVDLKLVQSDIRLDILSQFVSQNSAPNETVLTAISALNATLRMTRILTSPPDSAKYNSKSFFDLRPTHTRNLTRGLILAHGVFQNVRPAINQMIVNIDTTSTVMYAPERLTVVCMGFLKLRDVVALRNIDEIDRRALNRFLRGVSVSLRTEYRPEKVKQSRARRFKLEHLERQNAREYTFSRDGEEVTIERHFYQKYNRRLDYPQIPCVRLKSDAGNPMVVPMEALVVPPGVYYRGDIPPESAAKMIEYATMAPSERMRRVQDGWHGMDYQNSSHISHVGLRVAETTIEALARRLPPPTIEYGNTAHNFTSIIPREGKWNLLGGVQLTRPAVIYGLGVIVWDPTYMNRQIGDIYHGLVAPLLQVLKKIGVECSSENIIIRIGTQQDDVPPALDSLATDVLTMAGLEKERRNRILIVAVLKKPSTDTRDEVKRWGDIVAGIPTQIVSGEKIMSTGNRQNQYLNNLALKINPKMGGLNSEVRNPSWFHRRDALPTMIIGADVSHPGSPGSSFPSISAMVSTFNRSSFSEYIASASAQMPRVEIIENFRNMFERALKTFHDWHAANDRPPGWDGRSKLVPKRIVVYRDGVSEGEFENVAATELAAIRAALEHIGREAKTKITFIIVGKRHHIRFAPIHSRDTDRKKGNLWAGAVVDRDIVHPSFWDFYIQSHAGLLGTSRSSHYTVIRDDNEFTSDEIQKLSFDLCHVYARSTGSVSIPAPIYYADIVSARGRYHIPGDIFNSDPPKKTEEYGKAFRGVNKSLRERMYFM